MSTPATTQEDASASPAPVNISETPSLPEIVLSDGSTLLMDAPVDSNQVNAQQLSVPSQSSSSHNRSLYIQSVSSTGKVESTKLAPLNGGVLVEYVESHENLLKTIGLDPLPAAFFDGTLLHSEFKFPENASEKDIEKKLLEIINSKRNIDTGEGRPLLHCQAYNQVKTFDGGILDIIVFDELIGLEDAGAPISKLKPGRPITLVEVKLGQLVFGAVLDQSLGYSRTVMGRHAGLEALTVLMVNGNSFYFGVLYWENFGTLKFKVCTKLFDLKGENRLENCNLLQALLVHPAVLRERKIRMSPVDSLKHLPGRLKEKSEYLLMSATAIGGSTAVYLATDDMSRSKTAVRHTDVPTSPFESLAEVPNDRTAIIKFFRSIEDFNREYQILSYLQLQREDFGPRLLGCNHLEQCILYERLDVAEQSVFYNENWRKLSLAHFPALLSELEFMHSLGVVHQDIRSANVGFRKGEPVLMDFAFSSVSLNSPFHKYCEPGTSIPLFRLSPLPSGYYGTFETASDRIIRLKVADENADIKVTKHDDLCSLMKLWYLTRPGASFVRGVKSWDQLLRLWWLFLSLEDLEKLSTVDLAAKLRYIFTSRSGDYTFPPPTTNSQSKRRRMDLEKTSSVQLKLADLYDDITEDGLLPETDYLTPTRFLRSDCGEENPND